MRIRNRKARAATDADNDWSTLTYQQLVLLAQSRGIRVMEYHMPDLMSGLYSDKLGMILIRSDQLEHQKRVSIAHELVHAERHDGGCASLSSKQEMKARRETALRLIDALEYATAEQLHEGCAYDIACELNVTVQTIRDYQRWLESQPAESRSTVGRIAA
jgi:hypothetical protein